VEIPVSGNPASRGPRIRVLLLDGHASMREAMASAFTRDAGFDLVSQARDITQARTMLQDVDVAVMDLALPDGDGADLIEALREINPRAQALVLTATVDRSVIARAVQCGAAAVLHKSVHLDEVVDSARRLWAGETLMPLEEIVELLRYAGRERELREDADRAIAELTPRERELLALLAEGLDNEDIAAQCCISVRTVRNHMGSILIKLGVHSRLEALVFALHHGLVQVSGREHAHRMAARA
jgi:DNA-binding NarL/FixJ family response regulator